MYYYEDRCMKARKRSQSQAIMGYPYNFGQLPYISLYYIKSLCDKHNIQVNMTFKPTSIQLKFIRLNSFTGLQEKAETRVYRNDELGMYCTSGTIDLIVKNLLTDMFQVQ
jgi:UDP-galactopyranose mutase